MNDDLLTAASESAAVGINDLIKVAKARTDEVAVLKALLAEAKVLALKAHSHPEAQERDIASYDLVTLILRKAGV